MTNQSFAVQLAKQKSPKFHVGPIHSAVAGRTDHLPMSVLSGSYVLPADTISALGEGNTMAGFAIAKKLFNTGAFVGSTNKIVPIVAAGGEYVIPPEEVIIVGKGSIDIGHEALDEFVKSFRKKTVKTLSSLPGPKKD